MGFCAKQRRVEADSTLFFFFLQLLLLSGMGGGEWGSHDGAPINHRIITCLNQNQPKFYNSALSHINLNGRHQSINMTDAETPAGLKSTKFDTQLSVTPLK